jgi:hypothetical protein
LFLQKEEVLKKHVLFKIKAWKKINSI